MSSTVKKGATKKGQELGPEDLLRALVVGEATEVPPEGIPGVPIIYRSSPTRIHRAFTAGRVERTPEGVMFVDVSLDGLSMSIKRVQYGTGPRTWRFPSPTDPPTKRMKPTLPPGPRLTYPPGLSPMKTPRQEDAETE